MIRLALLLALAASPAHATCAGDAEPCATDLGDYHIRLPDTPQGAPAVMFLHGYGSRGANTIGNARLVEPMLERGYAVIAPNGIPLREGGPNGWSFYPGRQKRDDTAFLTGVADAAARRFGIDRDRVMLSGFSSGGFMVTYLACGAPESFPAYAPVAGGFWRPHPEGCTGPVNLLHTHGWKDGTVPLEGRPLGGGAFVQGDIFAGMEIWRETNGCTGLRPDAMTNDGAFWRRIWTECSSGAALEFVLFPGGHTVPEGWSDLALDWFEGLEGAGRDAGPLAE